MVEKIKSKSLTSYMFVTISSETKEWALEYVLKELKLLKHIKENKGDEVVLDFGYIAKSTTLDTEGREHYIKFEKL